MSRDTRADAAKGSQRWLSRLLIAVVLIGGLGLVGYASVGAVSRWVEGLGAATLRNYTTVPVRRGPMVVRVVENGNLESANNLDIRAQVAGGSSILWIVPDGAEVQQGDRLVELDSAAIEDQISQQRITLEKARSAMIQAEKDFSVAQISVEEYVEGIYKKELQDAEAQIRIAMEGLRSAENMVEHSERMFRKGYVSHLELESQHFAVERAQLELDSALTGKDVLERFTKLKTMEELQSQLETARARMESERAAFELEDGRLKRLEQQLAHCVITAPTSGMVVYANETNRRMGQQQAAIEEGAMVRERQSILRLPDLAQMQVRVNVHESRIEMLRPGMRARIEILGRVYQGQVVSIANQPEPGSWFSADVKEYATIVRIDGEHDGLRPGMTAEVQILVAHIPDALLLPVASVVELGRGSFFAWVLTDEGKVDKRPLMLGMTNDEYIEIKDGVLEGEQVVLSPRALIEEARRQIVDESSEDDVQQRFGGSGELGSGGLGGPGGQAPGGPGLGGAGGGEGRHGGGQRGDGGGQRGAGGGQRGAGGGGPNFGALDADGDGRISREEAPEWMQSFFDAIDTDGDGHIDRQEFEAMRARDGGRGGPGGPAGGNAAP